MIDAAGEFHNRFGKGEKVEEFKVFDKKQRHPQWLKKAEKSIFRVKDTWDQVGLEFPLDTVMEMW